ncbi:MAG: hypothetical protein JSU65_14750 [Candidatus Zixiibacteriota bacterium]|nr:MAG: hypothetical protein JSU65_14750 [candidate division Zixibacteria bacterium]
MRSAAHIGAVLAALLVCNTGVLAQPHVVLDSVGPLVCGQTPYNREVTAVISIANPDHNLDTISLSFKIYGHNPYFGPGFLRYYNGFDTLWGNSDQIDVLLTYPGETDYYTVSIRAAREAGAVGLPRTVDTIPYIGIRFYSWTYEPFDDTLCIDSLTSSSLGLWSASPGPAPTWSGSECHDMIFVPESGDGIVYNCPDTPFVISYCEDFQYLFEFGVPGGIGTPRIRILSGPGGTIDPITGLYEFSPDSTHIGLRKYLDLDPMDDFCGDGSFMLSSGTIWFVEVIVVDVDDFAEFAHSQQQKFVATTEDTLAVTLLVDDSGPCFKHECSYFIWPEDPDPPGHMDAETGTFYYYGATADTNTYWIAAVITEHGQSDTLGFYIYHYEDYECGNADHQGEVDIGDLTHLIGYLFQEGISPIPMAAGDVDCVEGIDIGDLTSIIDFLFITYTPLCDGC